MEKNINTLVNQVNNYLKYRNDIEIIESSQEQNLKEIKQKVKDDFDNIKNETDIFIEKTRKAIEIICSVYKNNISFENNRIKKDKVVVKSLPFNSNNAYSVIRSAGKQFFNIASSLFNYDKSLDNVVKLSQQYNTIVEINEKCNSLCETAINDLYGSAKNKLENLKKERNAICATEKDFDNLVKEALSFCESLYDDNFLGTSKRINTSFKDNIEIPLGAKMCNVPYLLEKSSYSKLPQVIEKWDLNNEGIVLIKTNNKDIACKELLRISINSTINFLFSYPGVNKKILICDSTSSLDITSFVGVLKNENADMFFNAQNGGFINNSEDQVCTSINELNRIINERIMMLGQSNYRSILEFNKDNQDNPQPLIFVLLNGYPSKIDNCVDSLTASLKNGQKAGVFFMIIENSDGYDKNNYYRTPLPNLNDLTKKVYYFKLIDKVPYLETLNTKYYAELTKDDYNQNLIVNSYKESIKDFAAKVVYLDNVVPQEEFNSSIRRKEYSKNLEIPIGKQGAKPISIDLSAKDAPHIAVIGTTGSGKTAFINTLVLSACKLYSPEELELHLIVMVKGDFRVFEECKLPHLKTVVTGDKIYAANDVLDFIDDEMKRRGEIIGSLGNIYAYNEISDKPLPRCMIIIDEFYQLVQGSEEAIERVNRIAQVGRSYGISLVVSSIRFPMEVNSLIPLFEHKFEFKSKENAGQLIPDVSRRQGELEAANGLCFYMSKGNLYSLRVAFSEEGDKLKNHINQIKKKYPNIEMSLQSEIKSFLVTKEEDVPFGVRNARRDYDEEGIIRTRLGQVYLSNRNLEYAFESKNNLLLLFGQYLQTKQMEASIIKDVLVLSKDIEEPTVFYADLNKNASLKRAKTIIKEMRDSLVLSNRMVYASNDEFEDMMQDIKDIIRLRETDDECDIYPIIVMISRAEQVFEDEDLSEELLELINKGQENNIYFVLQCNEMLRFYGVDKYLNNAILFPDKEVEGESYSSASLCKMLENMQIGSTEKGKKLIANASSTALDPRMHVLCNNNKLNLFIPYDYDVDYLKNIK